MQYTDLFKTFIRGVCFSYMDLVIEHGAELNETDKMLDDYLQQARCRLPKENPTVSSLFIHRGSGIALEEVIKSYEKEIDLFLTWASPAADPFENEKLFAKYLFYKDYWSYMLYGLGVMFGAKMSKRLLEKANIISSLCYSLVNSGRYCVKDDTCIDIVKMELYLNNNTSYKRIYPEIDISFPQLKDLFHCQIEAVMQGNFQVNFTVVNRADHQNLATMATDIAKAIKANYLRYCEFDID